MKNILSLLAISSFSAFFGNMNAQDLRFTQPFADPLKYNPACMGINPDLKFILHTRSQWSKLDKGYSSYSFSTLYPVYIKEGKEKLDVGLTALQDKAGAFKTLDLSLAVGYNLQISNSGYVNFSLLGGYVQKSLNVDDLSFDSQYVLGSYDAGNANNETVLNEKTNYPDAGVGAMWYFNPEKDENTKLNAYLGVSAFHLNKPNESFVSGTGTLPVRVSYQGGLKILGGNKIDVTPHVIVNTQKGSENTAAGVYVDYHLSDKLKASLGTWFRKKDAIAFHIGAEHSMFSFGYSYDIATSDIRNHLSGANAHEISLAYKINQSEKHGAKSNPSFFK